MFTVYTKDEAQVVAKDNKTLVDKAIDIVSAPISFSETELVTKKNRAISVITWTVLGALGGELFGHHRAAAGKLAFVPFGRP